MTKLSKRGQAGISNKLLAIIMGVVGVVVLISAAPSLWTILSDALANENLTSIPLLGSMTGIIGLVFGVVILIGALVYMFKLVSNRR